jgi:hypothetical protein
LLTFRQFLEGETLGLLPYELFFRKEMDLSKVAAKAAVEWAVKAGQATAPKPASLPEGAWDHIVDWAIAEQEKAGMSDPYKIKLDLALVVKSVIARVMRERYHLELMNAPINEHSELTDLQFRLAFQKVLDINKQQAQEILEWFRGNKNWEDLDHETMLQVFDKWDPEIVEDHKHPGMSYEDYVMDEISTLIKSKFKLDTRELV